MADNDPVGFDALARHAERLKEQAGELEEDLGKTEGTGYGGGGVVRATVRGDGRITDLRIDSSVIEPDDPETLAGLVIDAVHAAMDAVVKERKAQVTGLTDNLQNIIAALGAPRRGGGPGGEGRVQPRIPNRPTSPPGSDGRRRPVEPVEPVKPAGPTPPPRKER